MCPTRSCWCWRESVSDSSTSGRTLDIEPELVLAIVLPAILYPAAIDTSWRDFRSNLRPILLLAIGLVATTTLAVGIALKWLVPEVPWAVAFALGAVVSPPDAVAATAVLRRFPLPRRIVSLLEGESLVNDATGLVLYRFAVAAAMTGVFSGWELVGDFGLIALGGLAIGIAIGLITSQLQQRLHDPMLELAMSLTTPFAVFWVCESLEVSGVLGVVAAGLYRSRWSHRARLGALAPQHPQLLGRRRVHRQLPRVRAHRNSLAADRRIAVAA